MDYITASDPIHCWWCGIPYDNSKVQDITRERDSMKMRIIGGWSEPATDGHDHSAIPPTPAELLAAGTCVANRLVEVWAA